MLSFNEEIDAAVAVLVEKGYLRAAARLILRGGKKRKPRYLKAYAGKRATKGGEFRIAADRLEHKE